MPAYVAEMRDVNQLVLLTALVAAATNDPPGTTGFLHPAADIEIRSVRALSATDTLAGARDEYYIVRLRFTNDVGSTFAPKIGHFTIVDAQQRRYLGVESGDAALVGISNSTAVLRPGESREYTVGFRVPYDATGTLFYDDTF